MNSREVSNPESSGALRRMKLIDGFQGLVQKNVFSGCDSEDTLRISINNPMDNGDNELVNVVIDYIPVRPNCWGPDRELREIKVFVDGNGEFYVLKSIWSRGEVVRSQGIDPISRDFTEEDYARLESILQRSNNPQSRIRHYHSDRLLGY